MRWIIEAHTEQGFGKLLLQRRIQIGPGGEHAVIIWPRCPDFSERAFWHQTLVAHRIPERAADCAGIGATVEHCANDVGLARPGVAVLADVGVEAQRLVVFPFSQPLALQKVDRENCRMAAVAAAECKGTILEIGEAGYWPASYCDDLGHPAHIGIAHGDGSTTLVAPGIGLDKSEIGIPGDVDPWQRLTRRGEQRGDLHLITLKQHDFDRNMGFLVKVASHALPDTDHLRVIGDGTHPDRPAHDGSLLAKLNVKMRSNAIQRLPSGAAASRSEQRYP